MNRPSVSFFSHFFFKQIISNILIRHCLHGLFWILKKNKYIAFLNLKVFNDLFWKFCSSNISLEVHHLRLFIFLLPYRPLDGVKTITITNTSQTYFISISGYIGPHTCTVVYLCSISKGCKRKYVASAVVFSGESYSAARRLKAFMIMHMGLVKTIKLPIRIFFIIKYSQGPGLHRHPKKPDCHCLEFNDAVPCLKYS